MKHNIQDQAKDRVDQDRVAVDLGSVYVRNAVIQQLIIEERLAIA